ncbi:TIGR04104 family putative zinc finger protein [Metabacillus sp. Hm71]|uniref:TIGR04104 family putative zinc finger protein n=1 Tax=Metabacillus sp. Hm71 TaxID=3450743 RepID=UPI003F4391D2
MPNCQNCGKQWTWKQTVKSLFKFNCPYCGKKQYETASSRRRRDIFSFLPLLSLPINSFVHYSWITVLISLLIMITLIFAVYPFMIRLSNKEEPLW